MSIGESLPYRSPISKLLRFFCGSRDKWKAKCKEAKRENKSLKYRLLLCRCPKAASAAGAAYPVASHLGGYIKRLDAIETIIFPPQRFCSSVMIAKGAKCSICEGEYGECEHVAGKAYMGMFCASIVSEITAVESVDIVENPADKRCVFPCVCTVDGVILVDRLTLLPMESAKSVEGDGNAEPASPNG